MFGKCCEKKQRVGVPHSSVDSSCCPGSSPMRTILCFHRFIELSYVAKTKINIKEAGIGPFLISRGKMMSTKLKEGCARGRVMPYINDDDVVLPVVDVIKLFGGILQNRAETAIIGHSKSNKEF